MWWLIVAFYIAACVYLRPAAERILCFFHSRSYFFYPFGSFFASFSQLGANYRNMNVSNLTSACFNVSSVLFFSEHIKRTIFLYTMTHESDILRYWTKYRYLCVHVIMINIILVFLSAHDASRLILRILCRFNSACVSNFIALP